MTDGRPIATRDVAGRPSGSDVQLHVAYRPETVTAAHTPPFDAYVFADRNLHLKVGDEVVIMAPYTGACTTTIFEVTPAYNRPSRYWAPRRRIDEGATLNLRTPQPPTTETDELPFATKSTSGKPRPNDMQVRVEVPGKGKARFWATRALHLEVGSEVVIGARSANAPTLKGFVCEIIPLDTSPSGFCGSRRRIDEYETLRLAGALKHTTDNITARKAFYNAHGRKNADIFDNALPLRESPTLRRMRTFLDKHPAPPTPENTMIKIETITFVDNTPINDLTDERLFAKIAQGEAEITELEKIENKPDRLIKKISAQRKAITDLVTLINERDAASDKDITPDE